MNSPADIMPKNKIAEDRQPRQNSSRWYIYTSIGNEYIRWPAGDPYGVFFQMRVNHDPWVLRNVHRTLFSQRTAVFQVPQTTLMSHLLVSSFPCYPLSRATRDASVPHITSRRNSPDGTLGQKVRSNGAICLDGNDDQWEWAIRQVRST